MHYEHKQQTAQIDGARLVKWLLCAELRVRELEQRAMRAFGLGETQAGERLARELQGLTQRYAENLMQYGDKLRAIVRSN